MLIAPARGRSKPHSSHPVPFLAAATTALFGRRSGENKTLRKRTAENEACLHPLLWRRRGALRNSATLGRSGKPWKTLAFFACFRKALKCWFLQRPVGFCSISAFDFVGKFDGAQGQNRTADTRIFNPLLYRLSYLGPPRTGFLGEAYVPVQRICWRSIRPRFEAPFPKRGKKGCSKHKGAEERPDQI